MSYTIYRFILFYFILGKLKPRVPNPYEKISIHGFYSLTQALIG